MTSTVTVRAPDVGRRRDRKWNWQGLSFLVALILLWEVFALVGVVSTTVIPKPSSILGGLLGTWNTGELGPNLLHSVGVILTAIAIASVVGVVGGVLVGLSNTAWNWTGSSIDFLRSLSVIALVPVALVIFGLNGTSEVVVAAFAATWPILMNTVGGVRQIHPRLYDVSRTFGLSRLAVFWKIALPSAAPEITVGLRIGVTVCLLVTVAAEMVGNPQGLGYGLVRAQQGMQPERMYAYVAVILALGLILNALVLALSKLVVGRR